MHRSIALLLALTGVAACAPTDGAAPRSRMASADGGARQCFVPRQVINFRQGGTQQVYVRVFGGSVFQLSSAGCFDLDSTNGIAITPAMGISDRLCVGDSANITVSNPTVAQGACPARVVRSLSEAEISALPSNQRP